MTAPLPRYDVTHSDGIEVEVVRGLDRRTAARLVERDLNAGRIASMAPAKTRPYVAPVMVAGLPEEG